MNNGNRSKDFNDVHRERGTEGARESFDAAIAAAEAKRRKFEGAQREQLKREDDEAYDGMFDEPPAGLRFYFAEDLERRKVVPLEWDVEDFVPSGGVTGMFGDGGTGKDLLLFQLAAVFACGGGYWLGKKAKAGRVIYGNVEDTDDELNRRRKAIAEHYGFRFAKFPKQLMILPMAGKDTLLAAFDFKSGMVKPTELYTKLRDRIASFKPALVIVGNRVNIFGVNQNDDAQARQCMQLLSALTIDFDTTVIMPGHVSLSGMSSGRGDSGSVQWSNACRQRLYLSRVTASKGNGKDGDGAVEANPDVRQLEVKKANWGPTDQKISLRWSRGVFVVYDPLEDDDGPAWKFGDVNTALKEEDEFLRMLDIVAYPVSAEPKARNNAPKVFADDVRCKLRGGAGKAKLKAAMERLLNKGVIAVQEYGPPSKRYFRIVRPAVATKNETPPATGPDDGIPFMMLNATKQGLRARGYTDEQISQLTPQQARDILAEPAPPVEPLASSEGDELRARGFSNDDIFAMTPKHAREILADPECNKLTERYGKGADAPPETICRVCKKPGVRFFSDPDPLAGMREDYVGGSYPLHLECCPKFFAGGNLTLEGVE